MRRRNVVVLAVSTLVFAGLGAVIFAPASVWRLESLERLRTVLQRATGSATTILSAVGVGLVVMFLYDWIASGSASTPAEIPIEDRTGGVSGQTAGDDLDRRLAELATSPPRDTPPEEFVSVAARVLSRTKGLDREEAVEALEEGTWTDDPRAAAFFSPDPPPVAVRLRDWVATEPTPERQARHGVARLREQLSAEAETDDQSEDGTEFFEGITHRTRTTESVVDTATTASDAGSTAEPSGAAEESGDGDHRQSGHSFEVSRVRRQDVGIAVAFFCGGLGVALRQETLLLLSVLGVVYASYEFVSSAPVPSVTVSREIATPSPIPGDSVEVAVTVENVGDESIMDLRYVDGVPDPLAVVEGSPAFATALRPGEQYEQRYVVRAKRGTFEFEDSDLVCYGLSGIDESRTRLRIPSRIECTTLLDDVPLGDTAVQRVGTVDSDTAGSGIEFHSVREYRAGDPLSRVDWNRLAKTGELATVNFHEKRGTTVLLVVDVRSETAVSPAPGEIGGRDLCIYAAEEALHALLETGIEIGLVAYGGSVSVVPTDTGQTQRTRIRSTLRDASDRYASALETTGLVSTDTIEDGYYSRGAGATYREIEQQIPQTAQVIVFSPALDDEPVELVRQFQRSGHVVSMFSPAVAGRASIGQQLADLDRACRLRTIRETGAFVADWDPNEPLETAVTRLTRRHS